VDEICRENQTPITETPAPSCPLNDVASQALELPGGRQPVRPADRLFHVVPSLRHYVRELSRLPGVLTPASYLIGRRPPGIDQATWDEEYAAGGWAFLAKLDEVPRYAVIAGYCRNVTAATSLLDVGCGAGQLAGWVCQDRPLRYVGVDLSAVAIEQARSCAPAASRLEVADAATFDPAESFDIIVLNEMLYYMEHPDRLLRHYAGFLAPGGVFIISMLRSTGSLRIWRLCAPAVEVLGEVRLRIAATTEWNVWLCRPAPT
jgi:SAM-dependent methyltransferase